MATPSWLRYANSGATRNQPLDPRLLQALGFLGDMGVTAEVFSGGQPSSGPNRVGSHRHDHGGAGDMHFYRGGQKLDWANAADRPVFEEIVKRGKAAGITGWGAGPGYMSAGSMHVGFGSPSVWGAGGQGHNAPDWLRNAYNSIGGGGGSDVMVGGTATPPDPYSAMADGPKGNESYKPVFGSMAPGGGSDGMTADEANAIGGLLGGDKSDEAWGHFAKAGAYLDSMTPEAPRVGGGGGDARTGNALLEALTGGTVADALLKRRLGFLG